MCHRNSCHICHKYYLICIDHYMTFLSQPIFDQSRCHIVILNHILIENLKKQPKFYLMNDFWQRIAKLLY